MIQGNYQRGFLIPKTYHQRLKPPNTQMSILEAGARRTNLDAPFYTTNHFLGPASHPVFYHYSYSIYLDYDESSHPVLRLPADKTPMQQISFLTYRT